MNECIKYSVWLREILNDRLPDVMLCLCVLHGHFVCTWSTKCSYLKFLFSAANCIADSASKSRVSITQGTNIITAKEMGQIK